MRVALLAFAFAMLVTAATSASCQIATLESAITTNFSFAWSSGIPGTGTPTLVPAAGVADVEAGIRNVHAAMVSAGWTPWSGTTVNLSPVITWGIDTAVASTGVGQEIIVSSTTGGSGTLASATNNHVTGSAYAAGGHGTAPNGAGDPGSATVTTDDGYAEAHGGDGVGTGAAGASTANSATGNTTSVSSAFARGGTASAGVGGTATASADGNATAIGGGGDPTMPTSTGGFADSVTTNGANLTPGTSANSTGGSAATGGSARAAGPNTGVVGPNPPTGGTGGTATGS